MAVECHVHAHPAIASVSARNGQRNSAPYYSCTELLGAVVFPFGCCPLPCRNLMLP